MTTTHHSEKNVTQPVAQTGAKERKSQVINNGSSEGQEGRGILSGHDILDNNQVNILMAAIMTVGAMALVKVSVA